MLIISMDDFNNNVFGVGNDFNNGGSFSSPFSAPASHDAEASEGSGREGARPVWVRLGDQRHRQVRSMAAI